MIAASAATTPSGIPAVDARWGGLRSGHSVLLMGRAGAGRTALALGAVRASVQAGQMCLLLSPRAPQELTVAASAAGIDLSALHQTGRMRVLRIPSAQDLAAKGNAGLESAYRDLAGLASSSGAHRVVIEDFTPLVQFTTFEAFGAAFDSLRSALTADGAAFLLGLGEPANEPSRQLLDVVRSRVEATVHVVAGDGEPIVTMEERAPAETAPAPEAAAPTPAPTPEAAVPVPVPAAPAAPAPTPAAKPAPPAPAPEAIAPEPVPLAAPQPPAAFDLPAAPSPPASIPQAPAHDPFGDPPSNDGASVSVDEPTDPFGAPAMATAAMAAPAMAAPEAPSFGNAAPAPPSGIPRAEVEPAPPPDADLLAPSSDPFGRDPGNAFFDGGYLVDSRGAKTTPVTAAYSAPPMPEPFVQPAAPEAPAPIAPIPPPMPSFASLAPATPTAPAANEAAGARAALEAAYVARENGTPFLVIAARMEPTQPESTSFESVVAGLRESMPAGATLYADAARLRSLMVLPGADAGAASGVFAGLQQHLQMQLGTQSEATLQAVAAITVPNGQPFGSAQELWAYAVES